MCAKMRNAATVILPSAIVQIL